MRPIKRLASFLAIFSVTGMYCQELPKASVLVCYSDLNPDKIQGYKYVILESEHFNPFDLRLIRENNDLVLGYISMGEVNPSRYYFDQIQGMTLGKNPLWNSYYLNLSDSTTQAVMMGLVDKIKSKGFNGLFLDTVDAFGPWGPLKEQASAYVDFISKIKEKYPEFHVMQNAGLELVPRSKKYINSIAIESVVTDYNFDKSTYRMRKSSSFQEKLAELKKVNIDYNLPIILIEYADTKSLFKKVKTQVTGLKWDYFIGNIGLDTLPKFK